MCPMNQTILPAEVAATLADASSRRMTKLGEGLSALAALWNIHFPRQPIQRRRRALVVSKAVHVVSTDS
jgi:hypothetical protein